MKQIERIVNLVVIHCTGTPEGRPTTLEEVTLWHRKRGFRTIGYHYLIHLDGSISRGRDESEIGAHCKGFNKYSIGVAYVGGCDKNMKPKDTRTHEQKHALRVLIEQLKDKYPDAIIQGHNDLSKKACPSYNVHKENY